METFHWKAKEEDAGHIVHIFHKKRLMFIIRGKK